MPSIFKHRGDTLENWLKYDPVLHKKEVVLVATDAANPDEYNCRKVGDGVRRFSQLPLLGYDCLPSIGESSTQPMSQKATTDAIAAQDAKIIALQMAVWPLDITFNVSPVTIEVGVSTSVMITWSVKREGASVLDNAKVLWSSPSETSVTVTGTSKNVQLTPTAPGVSTFKIHVEYEGMTAERSANVTAVYPSYFGKVAAGAAVTADTVNGMTKIVSPSKSMTQSGVSLANQRLCFAYPKSFGALTSVKDGNNFETLDAYTRTEVSISGTYYYVYTMTSPVTGTGLKQVYS